jgi:hypothetical protein
MKPPILERLPDFNHPELLVDNQLESESELPHVEGLKEGYDLQLFKEDNQKILAWFQHLSQLFADWQVLHKKLWDPRKLIVTGSRGFNTSYRESDLDCTIVSTDFQDFLDFCIFLQERYKEQHEFSALKTHAGLPLLIIRNRDKNGLKCSMLEAIHPDNKLLKLEVTFRYPHVHKTIQDAGTTFFNSLSDEQRLNYIFNKRYLTLLKRAGSFDDKLIRDLIEELSAPIQIYADDKLQNTPDFDCEVLRLREPEVQRGLSSLLQYEAKVLSASLKESGNDKCFLFDRISKGERLAPDDWALGQELLEGPYLRFFKIHRDDISSQLKIDGKYYTSVPIITFSHQGKLYVLLMKNIGLKNSSDVKEIEWTAHGTRVDSREKEYPINQKRWSLFDKISQKNEAQSFILAAACRRLDDMGIEISEKHILKIRLIDRNQAGIPEENGCYNTTFLHINLGEKNPQELIDCCQKTSSRYAQWTQCFAVTDLIAQVSEKPHAFKSREQYELTYGDETLTVRMTTMRFILALSMLKEMEPDEKIATLWQLQDPSPLERALTWIHNREDEHVQITLFSECTNGMPAPKVFAFADKAELNPENFANVTLQPERLFLHHFLAQLIVKTKVTDKEQLAASLNMLLTTFQHPSATLSEHYTKRLQYITRAFLLLTEEIPKGTICSEKEVQEKIQQRLKGSILSDFSEDTLIKAYLRIQSLYKKLSSRQLSPQHKIVFRLTESDMTIAVTIASYEQIYSEITPLIKAHVAAHIQNAIDNKTLSAIKCVPCDVQQFFGITGPVASGKSMSEALARNALQEQDAIFVSSDEWNEILIEILKLKLEKYQKRLGKLTLAEAWFIKELIWQLIAEMNQKNQGVNVIQEAMSPLSLRLPSKGTITIYINTASPEGAVERVKIRGDICGRYVSGGETFGSYRWPWFNLIAAIDKGLANDTRLCLHVIDTDLSYIYRAKPQTERIQRATIATLSNQVLKIYDLKQFIKFVSWSYMINPSPTTPDDAIVSQMDEEKLSIELQKLYSSPHKLSVQLNEQEIIFIKLLGEVRTLLALEQQQANNPHRFMSHAQGSEPTPDVVKIFTASL